MDVQIKVKNIPGYKGYYLISTDSQIYSIHRKKYLSQKKSSVYNAVLLCKNGKRKMYSVHRLVAMVFLKTYNKILEVNHKDLNKKNNNISNLEMMTSKQNKQHAISLGIKIGGLNKGKPGKKWTKKRKEKLSKLLKGKPRKGNPKNWKHKLKQDMEVKNEMAIPGNQDDQVS